MEPLRESRESFDVDGMLGNLAKWLRILGFDAEHPCRFPSPGRIFVTARRRTPRSGAIIVDSLDCLDQLKQVLKQAGVIPDPALFLSRCLVCNVPVEKAPPASVKEDVPPAPFATAREFNRCRVCGRVYWSGSHGDRMKKRLRESGIYPG